MWSRLITRLSLCVANGLILLLLYLMLSIRRVVSWLAPLPSKMRNVLSQQVERLSSLRSSPLLTEPIGLSLLTLREISVASFVWVSVKSLLIASSCLLAVVGGVVKMSSWCGQLYVWCLRRQYPR